MFGEKVSVIMPTYKRDRSFMETALESLLIQSYENLEIVIVDDSPADYELRSEVEEYIKSIEDKRNERAEEILKAQNKVKELSKARSEMKIWEVKWNGKKLKDVTKGIKSKLGIEPVEVVKPGGTGEGSPEGIAAGGTRNTSISITLKNLVENIYFEGSINENKDDLIKQVEEALIRVLYSAQSAV